MAVTSIQHAPKGLQGVVEDIAELVALGAETAHEDVERALNDLAFVRDRLLSVGNELALSLANRLCFEILLMARRHRRCGECFGALVWSTAEWGWLCPRCTEWRDGAP